MRRRIDMTREAPRPPEVISSHWRWMLQRDFPEVIEVVNRFFAEDEPWFDEERLVETLRRRDSIGMVWVNDADEVIGTLAYQLLRPKSEGCPLWFFAIDPHTGTGGRAEVQPTPEQIALGRIMLEKMWIKVQDRKSKRLVILVREEDIRTQLLLKALDFIAVTVNGESYKNNAWEEKCIKMEYYGP